jgi:ribosome maturation factor RimP
MKPVGESPLFYCYKRMPVIGKEETIAKITEIAERVAAPEGLEIVDVQLLGAGRGRVLRIFIDRPQGVSHADCEFISQQVGTILDVEDVIPGDSYTFEVSSPGLERKLHKAKDFEKFLGQKAKVVLREPVENQRRWEGKLAGFADGVITLEPSAGKSIRFPLTQVEKANLKFEW